MRTVRFLAAGALLVVAGCMGTSSSPVAPADEAPPPIEAKKLVIGVSSYYGDDAAAAMRPLVAHLDKVLGIPVKLRVAEPYHELPNLLRTHEIDVAQLPPLAFVRLKDAVPGVLPLGTPIIGGSPTYLGHLYVKDGSPFQQLSDLKGKRIGYVSRESSSGYLFARDLLRRKGFDPDTFFGQARFYRSHPQVLQAVLSGEVDVGAAFDATSDWTGPVERPNGLRVLAKTERIPNDCFVAREGLDPGLYAALKTELLRLRPGNGDADGVLRSLRINGWVTAEAERYDRVRDVLARESLAAPPPEGPAENGTKGPSSP